MPRVIGGLNTFTVVSGVSMEPTLHTGDLIISRKADHYNVGDVVTYTIPDQKYENFRIVHRVIAKTEDGKYAIRGDNQDHADPWAIPAENIAGSKVLMIPRGGLVLGYARNPIGLALLFGALVTWVCWPRKPKLDDDETEEADDAKEAQCKPFTLDDLLLTDEDPDLEKLVRGLLPMVFTPSTASVNASREHCITSDGNPEPIDLASWIEPTEQIKSAEPIKRIRPTNQIRPQQQIRPEPWQRQIERMNRIEQIEQIEQIERMGRVERQEQTQQNLPSVAQQRLAAGQHLADWSRFETRHERHLADWSRFATSPSVVKPGARSVERKLTVDELIERWINDEADAPLPDQWLLAV